jgi:acetoin utilization protein AcuB
MLENQGGERDPQREIRERTLEKYRQAAVSREAYLLRRQRKEILEKLRRVAVVGPSMDSKSEGYVSTEKLLGLGVEVAVVLPGCKSYLGLPCHRRLRDVPGKLDIVQVYPGKSLNLLELANEAVKKGVPCFWVEQGTIESEDVEETLLNARVQVVENESLVREYIKHLPVSAPEHAAVQLERRRAVVAERMTGNPITVKSGDSIKDAVEKMKRGCFRHLPVVDDKGSLVGMLSDRDLRSIRPSPAFVSPEDSELQIWSASVRQAAVFDVVTISPEALLEQAAELMLRWEVGGLPVVDKEGKLIGIITYTDILREFVAGEMS